MSKDRKQVVVIGGGDVFVSYDQWLQFLKEEKEPRFDTLMDEDWKDILQDSLGDKYAVIIPSMPNKQNAKYQEWKIWFEKHIPHFDDEIVLVGHSLGGIFLAKYLSENEYPKNIPAVFLVAAPFDTEGVDYTLGDFALPDDLSMFGDQVGSIYLYQSKDDPVVPHEDVTKYSNQLPQADKHIFADRGHFSGELPEIADDITSVRWSQ